MDSLRRIIRANREPLYHDLGDNEFRILHLHPSRRFNARIRISLHTANFSDQPVYNALSYVWGSPNVTSTITVNGVRFKATINLVSALRHLRQEKAIEVLWVDAICINQLDVKERNHQVQMMAKIYKSAQEVIAWLGESENDTDEAMKLLDRWGTALAGIGIHNISDVRKRILLFQSAGDVENFFTSIEHAWSGRAWNALASLYNRPYWSRLWIVQEFVLARKIAIMCGSRRTKAEHLLTEVFSSVWNELHPRSGSTKEDEFGFIENALHALSEKSANIHHLLIWREGYNESEPIDVSTPESHKYMLFSLLFVMSFHNCTDPRDRIFGASGFCTTNSPQITVDYSLQPDDANAAFARGCVAQSYLQVLCYAGIGYSEESSYLLHGPSWVPEWTAGNRVRGGSDMPVPFLYNQYAANRSQRRACIVSSTSHDPATISLSGAVLDTITEVLGEWSDWGDLHDTRWKSLLLDNGRSTTYVNGMPILQAYFRTLCANTDSVGKVFSSTFSDQDLVPDSEQPGIGGFIGNFLRWYWLAELETEVEGETLGLDEILRLSSIENFFLKDDEPTLDCWIRWSQNAQKHTNVFERSVYLGSYGRSFFTTTNGYMGTGPAFARPGDKVCIIQGAHVPFLLRPDREGYLLVGEAFVLGLMDGEYDGGFEEIELH